MKGAFQGLGPLPHYIRIRVSDLGWHIGWPDRDRTLVEKIVSGHRRQEKPDPSLKKKYDPDPTLTKNSDSQFFFEIV